MTKEERSALQTVIDLLDLMMEGSPTRELADTSNYLQALLDGLES